MHIQDVGEWYNNTTTIEVQAGQREGTQVLRLYVAHNLKESSKKKDIGLLFLNRQNDEIANGLDLACPVA